MNLASILSECAGISEKVKMQTFESITPCSNAILKNYYSTRSLQVADLQTSYRENSNEYFYNH